MDHETAVRMSATECYLLGELTGEDRDAFEAHYFMCPECAEDVRALTVFTANAKAVFREEATGPSQHAGVLFSGRVLWLSAALNVVLLLGFGYALLKVQPDKNHEIAQAMAPQFVQDIAILGVARGAGAAREISAATRRIVFSFYLTQPFREIGYELKSESGVVHSRQILPAPPKEESAESHLSISTAGLKPGAYEIRFWGVTEGGETAIGQSKFRIRE